MEQWRLRRKVPLHECPCPFCRQPWGPKPASDAAGTYINLAQASGSHADRDLSLEALYGDKAIWVRAKQGLMGKRAAARAWRGLGN